MKVALLAKNLFNEEVVAKAMTYEQYYILIKKLLQEGKTTGNSQSENYLKYAKMNFQRMKHVYRTTTLREDLKKTVQNLSQHQVWLVLTEGWCGDAAQSLPAISRIAELSENIDLRILLRDENINIIDAYHTKGSRSIPKLIAVDKSTFNVLFTWGPRPKQLQEMVMNHRANPKVAESKFNEELHRKYAVDKTSSMQDELLKLINSTIN